MYNVEKSIEIQSKETEEGSVQNDSYYASLVLLYNTTQSESYLPKKFTRMKNRFGGQQKFHPWKPRAYGFDCA